MTTWEPRSNLAKSVVAAGFLYDPDQDIIYSKHDAWQRGFGYNWGYDAASPAARMIIDCETIYFNYQDSAWMIELWKGQYGLETGCEIGVYRNGSSHTRIDPKARAYSCAALRDQLRMKFTLFRNGQPLLQRGLESHWWLTGFKWGLFTPKTTDLRMDGFIEFPNADMRRVVAKAFRDRGYHDLIELDRSVSFRFSRPYTPQPQSRLSMEGQVQPSNEKLVGAYNMLKVALNISSNDPNAFAELDVPAQKAVAAISAASAKVQRAVSTAAGRLQQNASAAARKRAKDASGAAAKLHGQVAATARRIEGELSSEASTAYREIASFFERRVWHVVRASGTTA